VTDLEKDLRDVLHRRAEAVSPQAAVPPKLVSRARRRIARNAGLVVTCVAVIAFGAYAGLQALPLGDAGETPGTEGPRPSSTQPRVTQTGPVPCGAEDGWEAVALLEGAAGSRVGSFELNSGRACTLTGRPEIGLVDGQGAPLLLETSVGQAWWEVNGTGQPDGWPVVTVAPGDTVLVRVGWSNWCDADTPAAWTLAFPDGNGGSGGGTLTIEWSADDSAPPCNAPSSGSTLEVGPFELDSRPDTLSPTG
jgi:hypothetical protein